MGIDPDDLPMAAVFGDQVSIAVGDDTVINCELQVPLERAREWAGELFGAVSVAYREATGDPHALSDQELALLPPADAYDPAPVSSSKQTNTPRPGCASTWPSTSRPAAWTVRRCGPR